MRNDLDDATRRALATLGLRSGASASAIRRAFKRLALRHHPDHNIGDDGASARFRQVCEAYRVLTQPPREKARSIPADPGPSAHEPHVPGIHTTHHYHYPTREEIEALGRPGPFRPVKALGWVCGLALLWLVVLSVLRERAGIPPEPAPANNWVPRFLAQMSKRF